MGRPRTFDEQSAVRAAMELFWMQGYEATTPAELGEALGIGRGSLYHAFGSKHALYLRALEYYVDEQRRQFLEVLDGEGSTDERLRRALALVLEDVDDARGCMVTMAAIDAPPDDETTTAVVRGVLAGQREALRTLIEDGRRIGDLPTGPDTPDAALSADAIVALLNGVRVMQRAGTPPSSLVDMAMRLL
jgi:TetR/AcrR family transcriptional regulator, transcriptional repressor for nem operon